MWKRAADWRAGLKIGVGGGCSCFRGDLSSNRAVVDEQLVRRSSARDANVIQRTEAPITRSHAAGFIFSSACRNIDAAAVVEIKDDGERCSE